MGKKIFVGLSIEGQHIIAVKVEYARGKYHVRETETISVMDLVQATSETSTDPELATGDDLFGLAGAEGTDASLGLDTEGAGDLNDFPLGEGWLGGHSDGLQDAMTRAVQDLYKVLQKFSGKKIVVGLNIPSGAAMFNTMNKPEDIKKLPKIYNYVKGRVESIYGVENIGRGTFRWMENEDKTLTVASSLESSILLEIMERINMLHPQTIFINTLLPEEISLLRFSGIDKIESQGSTVLIILQKEGARIVFARKDRILSAMPIIPMKNSGRSFINKVFSRIMMELEKGQVNYVERFLIYDRTGDGNLLKQMLDQNFEGINSEMLAPGDDVVIEKPSPKTSESTFEDDFVPGETSTHLSAISVALSAAGVQNKLETSFNFVPSRVLDRQKVFKLKWHGILLLIMIAIAPMVLNIFYNQLNNEAKDLGFQMERNAEQIASLQEVSAQLRILEAENNMLTGQIKKIDELSKRSYLWTETLGVFGAELPNIRNTWITSLQYNDQGFVIEGVTMFRERIPRIADMFHRSGIQRVTVTERRERDVFVFTIIVDKIVEDPTIFDPKVVFEGEVTL
jgi:hypothetical protein